MKKLFAYNGTYKILLEKGSILIWQRLKFYKTLDGVEFWIEDADVMPVVHLTLQERKDLVNAILNKVTFDNKLFSTLIDLINENEH